MHTMDYTGRVQRYCFFANPERVVVRRLLIRDCGCVVQLTLHSPVQPAVPPYPSALRTGTVENNT
jgi:hypothetical protein